MSDMNGITSKWAIDMAMPNVTKANAPQAGGATPKFTDVLADVLDSVTEAQAKSKNTAVALQMGDPTVSVEDVAIASNEASLKFQTVLQTRNKLLQAYSEVMNMPV